VGVIGGHQVVPWGDLSALAMYRRRLDVDVLVCGRRRKEGIVEYEGAGADGKEGVNGSYRWPASIGRVCYTLYRSCKIGRFRLSYLLQLEMCIFFVFIFRYLLPAPHLF